MFGKYDLNFKQIHGDIEIMMEGTGKQRRYYRRCKNEEVEKVIYADTGNVVVCPVEPVNCPEVDISEHLQVEFSRPVVVASGTRNTFYATFPVEIGVFLVDRNDVERIDVFTKTHPKYTLYGPPESGIICKYWKSGVYDEQPKVEKFYEGVVQVDIMNNYREWLELVKLVFSGREMKLFYGENDFSYMHSFLNVQKKTVGDTGFVGDKPSGMHGSLDIYQFKGLKRFENFIMEWGFV